MYSLEETLSLSFGSNHPPDRDIFLKIGSRCGFPLRIYVQMRQDEQGEEYLDINYEWTNPHLGSISGGLASEMKDRLFAAFQDFPRRSAFGFTGNHTEKYIWRQDGLSLQCSFCELHASRNTIHQGCGLKLFVKGQPTAELDYIDSRAMENSFRAQPPLVRANLPTLLDYLRREQGVQEDFLRHVERMRQITGKLYNPD